MSFRCVMVLGVLGVCTPASAQLAAAPAATVGWQDGLVMQSAGGDYRLQVGTLIQVDGRLSGDDPSPVSDAFILRKARPVIGGRLTRDIDFRIVTEFAGGRTAFTDAYVDARITDSFRIRAGKAKMPLGYEVLIGDADVWLPERALPSSLVPRRDVGVQAHGELAGRKVSYAAGIFNGIPDGTSPAEDVDRDGEDVAMRVLVQPVDGVGVHLAGSTGSQRGQLPIYRTSVGQRYFSYAAGAEADGRRTRVAPAAFAYHGAFGGFGEYVRSSQAVARAGVSRQVTNTAWDVTATYLLTGEAASDRRVRPRAPFSLAGHHWGAFQLLVRRSHLEVDPVAFDAGFAAFDASRRAHQTTVGLNWYPNAFVKWYASYERTQFHGGAPRAIEHAAIVRAQLAF
jgi:phosphate-selective porin OprO/OprP